MHRKTVLITGANRGIGLGLTSKFLASGCQVIATARNPAGARDLWELEHRYRGLCMVHELDVTNDVDLHRLSGELRGQAIDILINNAGYFADPRGGFLDLTSDALVKSLQINAFGPIRIVQSLLPNLSAATAPTLVAVTSKMGSIGDNSSGGYYAYRMSKVALNMFVKSFAIDYPKIIAVALHPGWVKTDMGGAAAPTSVEQSTTGLHDLISNLRPKDSGKFLDFEGHVIPW